MSDYYHVCNFTEHHSAGVALGSD